MSSYRNTKISYLKQIKFEKEYLKVIHICIFLKQEIWAVEYAVYIKIHVMYVCLYLRVFIFIDTCHTHLQSLKVL